MTRFRFPLGIVALALTIFCLATRTSLADLVEIQYWDQGFANPQTNGGPLWTGVVDTVTNNLRIDSWEERPQHGADFLVPGNFATLPGTPLIWTARDSTGTIYDVPDSFGTGGNVTINDDFAFISSVAAQEMDWVFDTDGPGPSGDPPQPRTIGSIPKPTRIGWGGFARQETQNGPFVYYTANVDTVDKPEDTDSSGDPVSYDEGIMPRLPVEPSSGTVSNSFIASLDATVIVVGRSDTPVATIFAVPEPSAFLAVGLVAVVTMAMNSRRTRDRSS